MELKDAVAQGLQQLRAVEAQRAQQQHQAFLERFPREVWQDMTLQQYALGTDNRMNTYCYALEWGTPTLGSIRGGSSVKHVIFWHKKDGAWHYPPAYDGV